MQFIIVCLIFIAFVMCANALNIKTSIFNKFHSKALSARRSAASEVTLDVPKYTPGVDVPEEVLKHQAIYDMILVERINQPEKTVSGIILPKMEGQDKKQVGIVISLGKDYGLESEQGRIQEMNEIAPFKVGDQVYIKVIQVFQFIIYT